MRPRTGFGSRELRHGERRGGEPGDQHGGERRGGGAEGLLRERLHDFSPFSGWVALLSRDQRRGRRSDTGTNAGGPAESAGRSR